MISEPNLVAPVEISSTPVIAYITIYYPNLNISEHYASVPTKINANGEICLSDILSYFKKTELLSKEGAIFYFDKILQSYIYTCKFSVEATLWIPPTSFQIHQNRTIVPLMYKVLDNSPPKLVINEIKVEEDIKSNISKPTFSTQASLFSPKDNSTSIQSDKSGEESKNDDSELLESHNRKRHRERSIAEASELVAQWRKYYQGVTNEKNQIVRYTLNEAAALVGVPKKSLDDYLLMINHGKRLGFDFNANSNAKFGMLRHFIKRHKKTLKFGISSKKEE